MDSGTVSVSALMVIMRDIIGVTDRKAFFCDQKGHDDPDISG